MPTDYTFTGQRLDSETGLLYYGARYYDPLSGRFTQADLLQNNMVGMDPYAYVVENPETLIDPNGQMVGEPGEFGAGGDAAEAAALESGGGESFTDASSSTPIPYFSPEPSAVETGNTTISYDANTGQITTQVENADGSTTWSEVEPGTQEYTNDLQTFEYLSEGSPDESADAFAQGQTVEGGPTGIGEASDTGLTSTQTNGPETTNTGPESNPSVQTRMNPNQIRFTQNDISPTGRITGTGETYTLSGNIEALQNGTLTPEELGDPIRIFMKTEDMDEWPPQFKIMGNGTGFLGDTQYLENGQIYSLDNRRLYQFQQAGLTDIPVRWATVEEIIKLIWHFDTQNFGTSVNVRP